MTYDSSGRLASWTTDRGTASATYDPSTGLPSTAIDPSGQAVAYGFASGSARFAALVGAGLGDRRDDPRPSGRTVAESIDGAAGEAFTYDPAGQLAGIGQLSLSRDATSGLVTLSDVGPVRTTDTYDGADELTRATTSVAGSIVLDDRYARDALGRISTVVETTPAGSTTMTYAYDGSDRLSSVRVDGRTVETDAYDPAGDRIRTTSTTGTDKARPYDARDRLGNVGRGWLHLGAGRQPRVDQAAVGRHVVSPMTSSATSARYCYPAGTPSGVRRRCRRSSRGTRGRRHPAERLSL